MFEKGSVIILRDGVTKATVSAFQMDERGNLTIEYEADGVSARAIYPRGEIISQPDGTISAVPEMVQEKPQSNDLTVTITATDISEAFKEGFKMALGMNMLLSQFGLDPEKVTKAVENVGQIAVQAQIALENIQKQNAEILAKLEKLEAQRGSGISEAVVKAE